MYTLFPNFLDSLKSELGVRWISYEDGNRGEGLRKKNSTGNENTSQEFAVVNFCNNQQLPMSI